MFQGLWHGPPLGELRKACIGSFLRLGHAFELYTYGHVEAPAGVIFRDAEIIPQQEIFYYDNPESRVPDLGPFSDLFRFKLLSERGGWWIDVDTVCLSADIPAVERGWAQQIPEMNPKAVGTGQIAMRKGDPLADLLYTRCLALSRTAFRPREALGPHLLSATIAELGLPANVFGTPETFYPLRFIEMFKLWLPEFHEEVNRKSQGSLFLPIFQSFPQYIGIGFSRYPPIGSYLGRLCAEFSPGFHDGPHFDPAEIREGTRRYFQRNSTWAFNELRAVCGDTILTEFGP